MILGLRNCLLALGFVEIILLWANPYSTVLVSFPVLMLTMVATRTQLSKFNPSNQFCSLSQSGNVVIACGIVLVLILSAYGFYEMNLSRLK